jgi:hypothetical protein
VIGDHNHLLRIGKVDRTIAFVTGTMLRSQAKRALRLRSPRDTPLALPTNVLLLRWDTKPDKRIKRTFLRHGPTRRTSFMPMCVRVVKQGRLATGVSTRGWLLIQLSAFSRTARVLDTTTPGCAPSATGA